MGSRQIFKAFLLAIFIIVPFIFTSGCAKEVVKTEPVSQQDVFETPSYGTEKQMEQPSADVGVKEEVITQEIEEQITQEEVAMVEVFDPSKAMIFFEFDQYSITEDSTKTLMDVAKWMEKNSRAALEVEGHCCDLGTEEYNLALGERRANSALKYLTILGVSASRMTTISYGEARLLDSTPVEEIRKKNRRCQFVVK